jgi:hypothetical protein
MAYPTLAIHKDSKRIVRDGRNEDLSVSGVTRVRRFYAGDKYDFELRHPQLNSTDMTTLQNFYAANMASTFDFTWPEDGVTYTGLRFGRGGVATRWVSPGRRDAFVRLVGA